MSWDHWLIDYGSNQKLIQEGGPSTKKMKLKQIACDIQQVIEDCKKLQGVISRN